MLLLLVVLLKVPCACACLAISGGSEAWLGLIVSSMNSPQRLTSFLMQLACTRRNLNRLCGEFHQFHNLVSNFRNHAHDCLWLVQLTVSIMVPNYEQNMNTMIKLYQTFFVIVGCWFFLNNRNFSNNIFYLVSITIFAIYVRDFGQ